MAQYKTLPGMIQHTFDIFRNAHAFNYRKNGKWYPIGTEKFMEILRRLTLGLKALGVEKSQTVGLLSKSSPFWLLSDLAISGGGGISVPTFTHISQKHLLFQCEDAKLDYFIVIDVEQWETLQPIKDRFKKIIVLDVQAEGDNIITWDEVLQLGDQLSNEDPEAYSRLTHAVKEEDVATIIYTSGSTGRPKGVQLTHRNLISQIHGAHIRFPICPKDDRAFSVLPLAHVFERTLMYYYVSTGVCTYFCDDIRKVAERLKEVRPTVMAVVPRLLEKVYAKLEAQIDAAGGLKAKIGRWALNLAYLNKDNLWVRQQRKLADRLVYRKIREGLGDNWRCMISGGAPLPPSLCRFFINIGIMIYQGYGLTETSPVLACNFPGHNRIGTVGVPYPDVELRLGENGEVLARGPNVMKGYHDAPQLTDEVLEATGWFHTGDTGVIDECGYLTITGRIKEIYKTSGGKMVSPVPIEQDLSQSPLIDMAMVVADNKPFVTCLLFPDFEVMRQWKQEMGETALTDQEFVDGDYIRNKMSKLITQVNERLNRWEQVRKYRFVLSPPSIEGGELTPTLKIRRKVVAEKYSSLIENMYQESEESHEGTLSHR